MVGIGGRISRMTGETTSLPSLKTTREEWNNYFAFVRTPRLPEHGAADFRSGFAALPRMLALDLGAMMVLVSIALLVVVSGFEIPSTALAGLEIDWQLAFTVVIFAPLMEEIAFRGWMSGKPGHVLALVMILGGGAAAAMMAVGSTGEAATLRAGLAVIAAIVLAVISIFVLRGRPAMRWFSGMFPALFWLSTIAFASIHLFNYEEGNLLPLLPLVLPQFILGTILAYMRVNYGLWTCIVLHAIHNGLIIGAVAAAS